MEIVILDNMVATYAGNWVRVANTAGYDRIQIHDRFREQGFGEGAEEIEVEGVDFSPIGGASRLFVRRAANNTKAEIHKSGVVMLQTFPYVIEGDAKFAPDVFDQRLGPGGADKVYQAVSEAMATVEPKRGRGRPKGSPNKPKQPLVPTWPGV